MPAPAAGSALRDQREKERRLVYVRQLGVRITHWTVVTCVVILVTTGTYISHPFTVGGSARDPMVMATVRVTHFYTAIVFDVAVFARIALMFLGNRYARWDQFIPVTKARWRNVLESLKFYLFLRRTPAPAVGHDALDGLVFTVRFLIDFVIIFTGFAMYSRFTSYKSPLSYFHVLLPVFGGFQHTRWLHHVMMWVFLAFVAQHVTRVVLLAALKRDGTVESMFSGYKFVSSEELAEDESALQR
ncbi:MAG: Ni/Fe-hydrogenase, b-type cytochrome subunit [Candidatus Baltobacteraceae bacterium]